MTSSTDTGRIRRFLVVLVSLALAAVVSAQQPGEYNAITDVEGVAIGHYSEEEGGALTGTTVVLVEEGAVGGVVVEGSAPGTRETDLLDPMNLVQEVQAIVLSGGSAYGLDAATGVVRYLEERGIGYPVGEDRVVPIVPAAILFDLGRGGDWTIRPDADFGYQAALDAESGPVEQGNVGAGAGASAGGLKGGLGTASVVLENGVTVGAIVAVNSVGQPFNPETGELYGRFLELGDEFGSRCMPGSGDAAGAGPDYLAMFADDTSLIARNTTIGVIATNAQITKAEAQKIAQMAHDGYARAIRPSHTMFDGDTIFAIGTGDVELEGVGQLNAVGAAAADVMARAIVHAMLNAQTVNDITSYCDTYGEEGADQ